MISQKKRTSRFASIALPLPVNTAFTYLIPSELTVFAEVGRRALVPFGKRILTGFIIGISDNPGNVAVSKIKPIQEILDDELVFDNHMLKLSGWVADYYLSSLGEVLKTAMPHGTMIKSRIRVHLKKNNVDSVLSLTSKQKKVLEILKKDGHILLKKLERSLKESVLSTVRSLEKKGIIYLEREINTPAVKPKTERYVKPVINFQATISDRAVQQQKCMEILKKNPDGIPLAELLERYSLSRGVVNAVVNAGFAVYEEVEIKRRSKLLDQESINVDHPLNDEQRKSFRLIMDVAQSANPLPVLLKGVTGSGKTRVYIELVRELLKKGKGAIILVPEISLTPQTTRFFTSVFPDKVAVLHSAMSPGERYDMWHLIHEGTYNVVIGPRSAIFAPLQNPGIIIVDEEHDTSYKQTDTSPRYNARDVAVVRGNMLGIPVVLGSATPSMESWYNVSKGKYILSTLSERVESKPLPEIITVNMKKERAAGNYSSLSGLLRDKLAEKISEGEKSIILINRRGYASSIHCRSCGYILTCPHCEVGLTYHSSKSLAVCHWCGHDQIVLEQCPECGATNKLYRGMGTQKVEKELEKISGTGSIVRMDSDTTRFHNGHFKLLEEFRKGPAPILLGTQMVSKGHDIHEVTLVGIISADLSLFLPDFRAFERTFQLITQVAGRAGRGKIPGTVIMQTYNPDNYAVKTASKQDYESFAEMELKAREELNFPPFSRLLLIEMSSEDLRSLNKLSKDISDYLSENAPKGTEVLGPVEAPIARRKGRHRIHILIKTTKTRQIHYLIRQVIDSFSKGKETINIDVDPIDLM
ncbi:MAG TPA: primosomal protein N' [bacterium]|nr:primosomal protein N' [bacterium]